MRKTKKETFNPFNFIIFGGDGDLALRKIYPALFHRLYDGQITPDFQIFAICRRERSLSEFKSSVLEFISESGKEFGNSGLAKIFLERIQLVQVSDFSPEAYSNLITALKPNQKAPNIFYFSTPSSAFGAIASALKDNGLIDERSKVVLEKPLGNSLATAQEINRQVGAAFQENQ
jgi:glucose-6-phosphate 1-dehydrogenase